MEEQQNVQQPHGTTWWNHSHCTGIRPSALHCLQQLQAGASSSSSAQPLASTQESKGTASSGSVSRPQLPHNATSSQVPAGPTRNVTGNVMSNTLLTEAATQLSFVEFLVGCNLSSTLSRARSPAPPNFQMQLRRLFHTALLLLMRPPNSRSRSSFLDASIPKTLWIARSHHQHMEMPAVPHFPNPLTSPVPAAPAAPVVVRLHARLHSTPPPPPGF